VLIQNDARNARAVRLDKLRPGAERLRAASVMTGSRVGLVLAGLRQAIFWASILRIDLQRTPDAASTHTPRPLRLGLDDFVKTGLEKNDPLEHGRRQVKRTDSDFLILGWVHPIDDDEKPISVAWLIA